MQEAAVSPSTSGGLSSEQTTPTSKVKSRHPDNTKKSLVEELRGIYDPATTTDTAAPSSSVPYYVHPSTVNVGAMSTFLPLHSPGAFMASPMFSMNDGFQPSSFRPSYEFQIDPASGYLPSFYTGGGAVTNQNTANSPQSLSFAHNASYGSTLYGLHSMPASPLQRSTARWAGHGITSEHYTGKWKDAHTGKGRVANLGQSPRKTVRSPMTTLTDMTNQHARSGSQEFATVPKSIAQWSQEASLQSTSNHNVSFLQTSPSNTASRLALKLPSEMTQEIMAKLATGSAIPPPVPSLFAGASLEDTLEQSLYNPNQTTNVYIRGLPPDTSDDKLLEICERFGKITSSKAILEAQTNTCKGFGFACFETETDATACIAGLTHCGYQVSFAKESFSTRLKNLQDPESTNLYLSNLPATMHEKDLEELFQPYKVVSNRILRDSNNVSRGVGFARLSDRDSAEAIIQKFDNKTISADPQAIPLQVRFADSPSQKRLKGQTQRRRQWRAREYNLLTGHHSYAELSSEFKHATDSAGLFMHIPMHPIPYGFLTAESFPEYAIERAAEHVDESAQPRSLSDYQEKDTSIKPEPEPANDDICSTFSSALLL